MIRPIAFVLAVALLGTALVHAQEPPRLVVPKFAGVNADDPNLPAKAKDVVTLYLSPREAALAAFQAGYKAATTEKNRERSMRLFLVCLRRDPTVAKALYNLAILCAQDSRWEDAIRFQNEFGMQPELDPAWSKSSTAELTRLQTIARLEATPEGKLRKTYDKALSPALQIKDPIKALNAVGELIRIDKNRWEAHALAGILDAETKAFPESVKALDEAARLAPSDRKTNIKSAADVARSEATFAEQLKIAGAFWEKQQYDRAAKAYKTAWDTNPTRLQTGMQAVTGFLMADQVAPAVEILSQMLGLAPVGEAAKMSNMLQELSAISAEAKTAEAQPAAASPAMQVEEPAVRIRRLIGSLSSSEVELVVKSEPPLLPDTTLVTPMPDEELKGGRSETMFRTTESIYAMYKRDVEAAAEARRSAAIETPASAASETQPASTPAPPGAVPAPPTPTRNAVPVVSAAPSLAAGRLGPSGDGQEQPVTVSSTPSDATILVDDNAFKCVAPCSLRLTPGRHTLRATLAGHKDAQQIFNVAKGKALSVDVSLDSNIGFVKVETKTPGMPIYVNGQKTADVTPASLKLAEGEYEVGIEVAGERIIKKVSVTAGMISVITMSQ